MPDAHRAVYVAALGEPDARQARGLAAIARAGWTADELREALRRVTARGSPAIADLAAYLLPLLREIRQERLDEQRTSLYNLPDLTLSREELAAYERAPARSPPRA